MSNENKNQITANKDDDKQVEYLKATLAMMKARRFPSKQRGFKLITVIQPADGGDLIPIYMEEN